MINKGGERHRSWSSLEYMQEAAVSEVPKKQREDQGCCPAFMVRFQDSNAYLKGHNKELSYIPLLTPKWALRQISNTNSIIC